MKGGGYKDPYLRRVGVHIGGKVGVGLESVKVKLKSLVIRSQ